MSSNYNNYDNDNFNDDDDNTKIDMGYIYGDPEYNAKLTSDILDDGMYVSTWENGDCEKNKYCDN